MRMGVVAGGRLGWLFQGVLLAAVLTGCGGGGGTLTVRASGHAGRLLVEWTPEGMTPSGYTVTIARDSAGLDATRGCEREGGELSLPCRVRTSADSRRVWLAGLSENADYRVRISSVGVSAFDGGDVSSDVRARTGARAVVVHDFNGDGAAELIHAAPSGGLYRHAAALGEAGFIAGGGEWHTRDWGFAFDTPDPALVDGADADRWYSDLAAADVDGDGRADLVALSPQGGIEVFVNRSSHPGETVFARESVSASGALQGVRLSVVAAREGGQWVAVARADGDLDSAWLGSAEAAASSFAHEAADRSLLSRLGAAVPGLSLLGIDAGVEAASTLARDAAGGSLVLRARADAAGPGAPVLGLDAGLEADGTLRIVAAYERDRDLVAGDEDHLGYRIYARAPDTAALRRQGRLVARIGDNDHTGRERLAGPGGVLVSEFTGDGVLDVLAVRSGRVFAGDGAGGFEAVAPLSPGEGYGSDFAGPRDEPFLAGVPVLRDTYPLAKACAPHQLGRRGCTDIEGRRDAETYSAAVADGGRRPHAESGWVVAARTVSSAHGPVGRAHQWIFANLDAAARDLTGNGVADLITTHPQGYSVWVNRGDGRFEHDTYQWGDARLPAVALAAATPVAVVHGGWHGAAAELPGASGRADVAVRPGEVAGASLGLAYARHEQRYAALLRAHVDGTLAAHLDRRFVALTEGGASLSAWRSLDRGAEAGTGEAGESALADAERVHLFVRGYCLADPTTHAETGANLRLDECYTHHDHIAWHHFGDGTLRSKIDPAQCITARLPVASGAGVELQPCDGSKRQRWIKGADGGVHSAVDEEFGLGVADGEIRDDAPVVLQVYTGRDHQQWSFPPAGLMIIRQQEAVSGLEPIRLRSLGYCLDDASGTGEAGARVQLWSCLEGRDGQQWYHVESDGTVRSYVDPTQCLVPAAGIEAGSAVELRPCGESAHEQWVRRFDGGLRSALDESLGLSVVQAEGHDGAALELATFRGESHQQWRMGLADAQATQTANPATLGEALQWIDYRRTAEPRLQARAKRLGLSECIDVAGLDDAAFAACEARVARAGAYAPTDVNARAEVGAVFHAQAGLPGTVEADIPGGDRYYAVARFVDGVGVGAATLDGGWPAGSVEVAERAVLMMFEGPRYTGSYRMLGGGAVEDLAALGWSGGIGSWLLLENCLAVSGVSEQRACELANLHVLLGAVIEREAPAWSGELEPGGAPVAVEAAALERPGGSRLVPTVRAVEVDGARERRYGVELSQPGEAAPLAFTIGLEEAEEAGASGRRLWLESPHLEGEGIFKHLQPIIPMIVWHWRPGGYSLIPESYQVGNEDNDTGSSVSVVDGWPSVLGPDPAMATCLDDAGRSHLQWIEGDDGGSRLNPACGGAGDTVVHLPEDPVWQAIGSGRWLAGSGPADAPNRFGVGVLDDDGLLRCHFAQAGGRVTVETGGSGGCQLAGALEGRWVPVGRGDRPSTMGALDVDGRYPCRVKLGNRLDGAWNPRWSAGTYDPYDRVCRVPDLDTSTVVTRSGFEVLVPGAGPAPGWTRMTFVPAMLPQLAEYSEWALRRFGGQDTGGGRVFRARDGRGWRIGSLRLPAQLERGDVDGAPRFVADAGTGDRLGEDLGDRLADAEWQPGRDGDYRVDAGDDIQITLSEGDNARSFFDALFNPSLPQRWYLDIDHGERVWRFVYGLVGKDCADTCRWQLEAVSRHNRDDGRTRRYFLDDRDGDEAYWVVLEGGQVTVAALAHDREGGVAVQWRRHGMIGDAPVWGDLAAEAHRLQQRGWLETESAAIRRFYRTARDAVWSVADAIIAEFDDVRTFAGGGHDLICDEVTRNGDNYNAGCAASKGGQGGAKVEPGKPVGGQPEQPGEDEEEKDDQGQGGDRGQGDDTSQRARPDLHWSRPSATGQRRVLVTTKCRFTLHQGMPYAAIDRDLGEDLVYWQPGQCRHPATDAWETWNRLPAWWKILSPAGVVTDYVRAGRSEYEADLFWWPGSDHNVKQIQCDTQPSRYDLTHPDPFGTGGQETGTPGSPCFVMVAWKGGIEPLDYTVSDEAGGWDGGLLSFGYTGDPEMENEESGLLRHLSESGALQTYALNDRKFVREYARWGKQGRHGLLFTDPDETLNVFDDFLDKYGSTHAAVDRSGDAYFQRWGARNPHHWVNRDKRRYQVAVHTLEISQFASAIPYNDNGIAPLAHHHQWGLAPRLDVRADDFDYDLYDVISNSAHMPAPDWSRPFVFKEELSSATMKSVAKELGGRLEGDWLAGLPLYRDTNRWTVSRGNADKGLESADGMSRVVFTGRSARPLIFTAAGNNTGELRPAFRSQRFRGQDAPPFDLPSPAAMVVGGHDHVTQNLATGRADLWVTAPYAFRLMEFGEDPPAAKELLGTSFSAPFVASLTANLVSYMRYWVDKGRIRYFDENGIQQVLGRERFEAVKGKIFRYLLAKHAERDRAICERDSLRADERFRSTIPGADVDNWGFNIHCGFGVFRADAVLRAIHALAQPAGLRSTLPLDVVTLTSRLRLELSGDAQVKREADGASSKAARFDNVQECRFAPGGESTCVDLDETGESFPPSRIDSAVVVVWLEDRVGNALRENVDDMQIQLVYKTNDRSESMHSESVFRAPLYFGTRTFVFHNGLQEVLSVEEVVAAAKKSGLVFATHQFYRRPFPLEEKSGEFWLKVVVGDRFIDLGRISVNATLYLETAPRNPLQ